MKLALRPHPLWPPLRSRCAQAASVREVAATAEVRSLSTLPRVDYADAFLVEPGLLPGQTAEEWASSFFERSPVFIRKFLPRGWASLGLKLGPSQADRLVFGWPVRSATPDLLLLGADSSQGMPAELLFKRHDDGVLFATFLQHENPLARARWAGIAARHRQIVRYLLAHAANRSASTPARIPAP
jgi:hypothetical protein